MRNYLWVRLAIGMILLLVVTSGWGCSDEAGRAAARRGEAPEFLLEDVEGGVLQLSSLRGKVVLLHFWATWCAPCTQAIPHERELQEKYADEGLVVVGLSMDREPEAVREFLEGTPVNYPVAVVDPPTRQAYGGVPTVPLTILVDRRGVIRTRKMGFRPEDAQDWERRIRRLLEEG